VNTNIVFIQVGKVLMNHRSVRIMPVTTSSSVGSTVGERPKKRSFTLKTGGSIMAMRGGKKKKKKTRGGSRRK